MDDPEPFVARYGEEYRRMIVDALAWLNEREPKWNLPEPMDRSKFIDDLVQRSKGIEE